MSDRALIVENSGHFEVRCRGCGKLLFKFSKKSVDISTQNIIIIARCPRSGCKLDNKICF
jgi:hypothetical protein